MLTPAQTSLFSKAEPNMRIELSTAEERRLNQLIEENCIY